MPPTMSRRRLTRYSVWLRKHGQQMRGSISMYSAAIRHALNAFNKVMARGRAQMAPRRRRRRRYLYVCTTLITSVMFVYFSLGAFDFGNGAALLPFYFMRSSWSNMMRVEREKTHTHAHAHTRYIPKPGEVDDGSGPLFHPRPVLRVAVSTAASSP